MNNNSVSVYTECQIKVWIYSYMAQHYQDHNSHIKWIHIHRIDGPAVIYPEIYAPDGGMNRKKEWCLHGIKWHHDS